MEVTDSRIQSDWLLFSILVTYIMVFCMHFSTLLPESIHSLVVIDFVPMAMPWGNITGIINPYLDMPSWVLAPDSASFFTLSSDLAASCITTPEQTKDTSPSHVQSQAQSFPINLPFKSLSFLVHGTAVYLGKRKRQVILKSFLPGFTLRLKQTFSYMQRTLKRSDDNFSQQQRESPLGRDVWKSQVSLPYPKVHLPLENLC